MTIKLSFTTREISKPLWRQLYRQLRIVNRETQAAAADMIVFGTGAIRIGPEVPDFIQRVHPANADGLLLERKT